MSSETFKRLLVMYLTPVTTMFVRRSRRPVTNQKTPQVLWSCCEFPGDT